MGIYTRFKVLLDDPAEIPVLHFGDYASALSEMIVHSRADFAVGVFGSWGSGKTTLMRAIERELAADPSVVTVWFTAWRYEREAHLIVPLIDVLRGKVQQPCRPASTSSRRCKPSSCGNDRDRPPCS